MDPKQFENLSPAAFAGLQPGQLKKLPKDLLTGMDPKAFDFLNPQAFGGFKPGKFNDLAKNLIKQMDDDQLGELVPKTFAKLDGDLVAAIKPRAFAGMTSSQGRKMNQVVASNFSPAQIQSIQPECLASLPDPVFQLLEGDHSAAQLNGMEAL